MCIGEANGPKKQLLPKCKTFFKEVEAINKTKNLTLLHTKGVRYSELMNLARERMELIQANESLDSKQKNYEKTLKQARKQQ